MEKTTRFLKTVVLLGIFIYNTQALAVPIVSLQPNAAAQTLGSSFNLQVNISAVTDLYGYQFDIQYNPTVLSAKSISEGLFLSAGGSTFFIPGPIDNAVGKITFTSDVLISSLVGVTGSGTLATLSFSAIGRGASAVSLLNVELLDSNFDDIAFATTGANITVDGAPRIPEANSGVLMSFGMLGMVMLGKVRARVST